MRQTAFPGMVTAGGGSSGAVMARTARPETDATYAGGTPGIAGGSGGTTGGAATAGTVVEAGQGPSSGTTPADRGSARYRARRPRRPALPRPSLARRPPPAPTRAAAPRPPAATFRRRAVPSRLPANPSPDRR